jgi:hypothetical protein
MTDYEFKQEFTKLLTLFNINAEQVLYLINSLSTQNNCSLRLLDDEEYQILQRHHEQKHEQTMQEMAYEEEYQLRQAEEAHLASMSFDEIMSLPEPKPSVRDNFEDDLPW